MSFKSRRTEFKLSIIDSDPNQSENPEETHPKQTSQDDLMSK